MWKHVFMHIMYRQCRFLTLVTLFCFGFSFCKTSNDTRMYSEHYIIWQFIAVDHYWLIFCVHLDCSRLSTFPECFAGELCGFNQQCHHGRCLELLFCTTKWRNFLLNILRWCFWKFFNEITRHSTNVNIRIKMSLQATPCSADGDCKLADSDFKTCVSGYCQKAFCFREGQCVHGQNCLSGKCVCKFFSGFYSFQNLED